MPKVTIVQKIINTLTNMKVHDKLSMQELVKAIYSDYDYFTRRSYDVSLTNAKKKFPDRKYKVIEGDLTRLE